MLSRKIWVRYQAFENLKPSVEVDPRDWLSDAERRESERYRDKNRMRQWLAGRWLAKQLLNEQLVPWSTPWKDIEICSRDDKGRAVRPVVQVQKTPQPWCVSISHSRRGVLVAVSLHAAISVGVDLTEQEDLNPQSLVFWFSARERAELREGDARQSAMCWAVKEAVYKAVNTGESFVPRKFEVFPRDTDAYDCHYEGKSLMERSRISVWDVDDHVAVTAMVSSSAAALADVPKTGNKMKQHTYVPSESLIMAGVS